jgi:leucyl/phenylalanyl-tRNA--protein transferase
MVLFPDEIKISSSMKKVLRDSRFRLTQNTCFEAVVQQCATIKRPGAAGTWITDDMKQAYINLHHLGYAKSVEVWEDNVLVGGLYGIDLGHVFCGESMFSKVSNASKYAFIQFAGILREKKYKLIDCQMYTPHLERMGAREIPRSEFLKLLSSPKIQ